FGIIILTHIPSVQRQIGIQVSESLSQKLGTKVRVGRVDLGFLNRIIIDDVSIEDQKGKHMFLATRVSAKFDYPELARGRIAISSAQLFGMNAVFYKETASSKTNFQFILDSLASKDTTKSSTLDLAINSLIIRNGRVRYDQIDSPSSTSQVSPRHLDLREISAHFIVNALTNDSLNLNVKKLALKESKGLDIRSLSFRLIAGKTETDITNFRLQLPRTDLQLGDIRMTYRIGAKGVEWPSLQYEGSILPSQITPGDLACVESGLKNFTNSIQIRTAFSGTSTALLIKELEVTSDKRSINMNAFGSVSNWQSAPRWSATINHLTLKGSGIKFIADNLGKKFDIPAEVTRLGDINYRGKLGGTGTVINAAGTLRTEAGNAEIVFEKRHQTFRGKIETSGINLQRILDDNHFGIIATHLDVKGRFTGRPVPDLQANGVVTQFDYNDYSYKNLYVNGTYLNETFDGIIGMDDPNGKIDIKGTFTTDRRNLSARITAAIEHLNPSALQISSQWPGASFSLNASADFQGSQLSTAEGSINVTDFSMKSAENDYQLSSLQLNASQQGAERVMTMASDFGDMQIRGKFDYRTIVYSITNMVRYKFPSIGLRYHPLPQKNNFSLNGTIYRSDWLQQLLNLPVELNGPFHVEGGMDENKQELNLTLQMPDFAYNGRRFKDATIMITSPNDSLRMIAHAKTITGNGGGTIFNLKASAFRDVLNTDLTFNNFNANQKISGQLLVDTRFLKDEDGNAAIHSGILPSHITVGDTIWTVNPSHISYTKNHLAVNHLAIVHNNQHIMVNGLASANLSDSLFVDLNDIDVAYLQNLLNFHPVDFDGAISGKAFVAGAFRKPEAKAALTVNQFKFENGRMGTLFANVNLNNEESRIDIDAVAKDEPGETLINGYVSPQHGNIDLVFSARQSRLELVEGFCSSFMRNVNVRGDGELRLSGPLKSMNLTGQIVANGTLEISSINTVYALRNDTVRFVPNEIVFNRDTVYDAYNNIGILQGAIHHQNLKNLSFDIGINARNLLSYNFKDFGDNTFYGTVFATGKCDIKGRSGEVTIDVDARPERNTRFVYNASSPDAITNNLFINWRDRDSIKADTNRPWLAAGTLPPPRKLPGADIPTDIRLNFLLHCTQDLTVDLIMDEQSGDYISLNGDGVIRAAYFNKGGFDMFGNYVVDHGIYKLSIQNAIKKDFQFAQGGTISFGGNPYDATLNLKAQYMVNGVSLSDLHLGHSFGNSNIPVNCLMNISGSPNAPKVDFNLDLPTLGTDAKQMIYSLINSEEEMNQQVLYLLAIGRFYSQRSNNAGFESSQNNTSLAMQSLLSGTVSQQLNSVLSSITKNPAWNIGANISTGDEGWNNAEYEGLLNGRLLNNRLLINGQFGYRDNPNATTSFIGDFDIRYLLTPNGNFAIKVYNQTNDRYFTRNSLTTQGLGLIIKKDFNGLRDLFSLKPKKAAPTGKAMAPDRQTGGKATKKKTKKKKQKNNHQQTQWTPN
ncbi:MAG: translocation/assembly module TamB, partial [Prevotella sp.]|nr:translocation/assembly module TamB [Prevotella sp.]